MQTATIEPARLTIADLERLAVRQSALAVVATPPAPARAKVTRRDAEHEILGAVKLIARINGMDSTKLVHPVELLVERIDQLEDAQTQLQQQNADLRKALSAISMVLEGHEDPFEVKPPSKWKKIEADKWMLAAGESIKWALQRAENALAPSNAVPIASDPE